MIQLEINTMIKREMESGHITVAALASALQITHSTASTLVQRPTIQVSRLVELSEFFRYNFFREIAQKLPYSEPDDANSADKVEIIGLQSRVRDLELEVKILRETIRDLVSR